MKLNVVVVVGNPKPYSRTRMVAELLVRRLLMPESYRVRVIDLADHAQDIFQWPSPELSCLNGLVAR